MKYGASRNTYNIHNIDIYNTYSNNIKNIDIYNTYSNNIKNIVVSNTTAIKSSNQQVLLLNFKRGKFFPGIMSENVKSKRQTSIITSSLGILSKTLDFKKSLKVSKPSYLRLSEFLRNCLLSVGQVNINFLVKGVPKYLKDILSEFLKKSDKSVANPFGSANLLAPRLTLGHSVSMSTLSFSAPYAYKPQKIKKKGRVKRKILKKVVKVNRIVD